MNDPRLFYRDGTPKPRSYDAQPRRSMREIKADYNKNLQKHSIPMHKRRF